VPAAPTTGACGVNDSRKHERQGRYGWTGLDCGLEKYEHRRAERGARPIYLTRSLRLGGGASRGAWPGEVAVTKLVQGGNPILHNPAALASVSYGKVLVRVRVPPYPPSPSSLALTSSSSALPSRQAPAVPSPARHDTPPLVPFRQAPAVPSPLRHDTPPLVHPRPAPTAPSPFPFRGGGASVQPWSERSPWSRQELEGQTRQ
jgi:hypothetical protein